MPHDVAVPVDSADVRSSIGEIKRKQASVALEPRQRAFVCGAKAHRRLAGTIPFSVTSTLCASHQQGDLWRAMAI